MKLIINTSTLSASGATQVAVSFILECIDNVEHEYHLFLSPMVKKQLIDVEFPNNFVLYDINHHPGLNRKGAKIRKYLKSLEETINPDVVFSTFGPSWWSPKKPHLQGYAYAHYIYPESPLFPKLSFKERVKIKLMKLIHLYFLNTNGNYFVSETEDVSQRLKKKLPQSKNLFYTVSNTYNSFFSNYIEDKSKTLLSKKTEKEFRLLSLCTYHVHKNLEILNEVIPVLNERGIGQNIKFVLTIDDDNFKTKFTDEAKASIINVGRVDVKDCPQLYTECDALFLPTLLECFSANYPEAMKMKKPILTSNLSFATTVCGDAALYFDPMDKNQIANQIELLINNENLCKELVEQGEKRLDNFSTSSERAKQYLEICKNIV